MFLLKESLPDDPEDKKWQWNLDEEFTGWQIGMMFNTDMELAYDIDVDPIKGTKCELNVDCPIAPTMKLVEEYSKVYAIQRVW